MSHTNFRLAKPETPATAYVYFIRTTLKPYRVKIGKAIDPEARLKALQTGCPFPMKMQGTLACDSEAHAFEVEKALHAVFAPFRLEGEWFKYSDVVKQAIHRVIYSGEKSNNKFFSSNKWRSDWRQAMQHMENEVSKERASNLEKQAAARKRMLESAS